MSDRPSIWDGSVQDKGFQLRQEQLIGTGPRIMKTTESRSIQYEASDGTYLLELDFADRQVYVPQQFIKAEHIAEFVEAVQSAQKEIVKAAQRDLESASA